MASPVKTVSDLWAAYETGGVDAVLARVGDEMVWQPDPFMGTVLRDPDELRAFAARPTARSSCWRSRTTARPCS